MKKNIFKKGSGYLLIALIAGLILLLLSNTLSLRENTQDSGEEEFELCERRCEERLVALLSEVGGMRSVKVMVTLDEIPNAKERPRVRGVAVVFSGNESGEIRLKAVMLISSALGITSDKIFVTFS